jgi:hypothetical protein
MRVEEKLSCFGYYGFGGGWARAKHIVFDDPRTLYCSGICPSKQACWDAHKKRAASLLPAAVECFEEMAREMHGQGPALVKRFVEESGMQADPYTIVMMGNIDDGITVALEGRTKDRGEFSLPWPLKPIS